MNKDQEIIELSNKIDILRDDLYDTRRILASLQTTMDAFAQKGTVKNLKKNVPLNVKN